MSACRFMSQYLSCCKKQRSALLPLILIQDLFVCLSISVCGSDGDNESVMANHMDSVYMNWFLSLENSCTGVPIHSFGIDGLSLSTHRLDIVTATHWISSMNHLINKNDLNYLFEKSQQCVICECQNVFYFLSLFSVKPLVGKSCWINCSHIL